MLCSCVPRGCTCYRNNNDENVLHRAVEQDSPRALGFLLALLREPAAAAAINGCPCACGEPACFCPTPFFKAAQLGRADVLTVMLSAGCSGAAALLSRLSLDDEHAALATALSAAALGGHVRAVEVLAQAACDAGLALKDLATLKSLEHPTQPPWSVTFTMVIEQKQAAE